MRCGVRFLTEPSTRERKDLCCMFGCRKHRDREKTNERSRRYNQTPAGRKKKRDRNRKRSLTSHQGSAPHAPSLAAPDIPAWGTLRYCVYLLWLSSGQKTPIHEIRTFVRELWKLICLSVPPIVRQRPLVERGG